MTEEPTTVEEENTQIAPGLALAMATATPTVALELTMSTSELAMSMPQSLAELLWLSAFY